MPTKKPNCIVKTYLYLLLALVSKVYNFKLSFGVTRWNIDSFFTVDSSCYHFSSNLQLTNLRWNHHLDFFSHRLTPLEAWFDGNFSFCSRNETPTLSQTNLSSSRDWFQIIHIKIWNNFWSKSKLKMILETEMAKNSLELHNY